MVALVEQVASARGGPLDGMCKQQCLEHTASIAVKTGSSLDGRAAAVLAADIGECGAAWARWALAHDKRSALARERLLAIARKF
jgi:hypothetical protein